MPLASETIATERLRLEPLRAEDADEMAAVLNDERLYEFTGGAPPALPVLRKRYAALAAGSEKTNVHWLNWIVRLQNDASAIGTLQATITNGSDGVTALVAWVIGVPWQSRGYATEAARALVAWLRTRGAQTILANVHPDHLASAKVAERTGFEPTDEEANGERIWRVRG
ncbi:MAG TPA: GNAT family N-acetyltransferase [Gaiellaceae bacterium]|nr:GNAT family N-acetyltransferase [Gaiellaceae bacterium]